MPIHKTKDESFFKEWSAEMAYVLGYFAADGSMIRNKRAAHYIEFQSTDVELIKLVKGLLKTEVKITSLKRQDRWKKIHRIQIGSKALFEDLKRLGFTQNKSLTMRFSRIPREFVQHFVRGYFDGDGCVNLCRYVRKERNNKPTHLLSVSFVSGSRIFLSSLKDVLKTEVNLKGGSTCYHSRGYRLAYSTYDSLRLFLYFYKNMDDSLLLKRKWLYFQKAFFGIDWRMLMLWGQ